MSTQQKRTPVISLGAGVQSSALLLMALAGRFDVCPELAIFADTHHEPRGVYEHLAWLEEQAAGRIEIVRVSAGDLLDVALNRNYNPVPLYRYDPKAGRAALGRRQCTKEFKITPIAQELRRRGFGPSRPVQMWLGISLDESLRMRPSPVQYIENRWPLIEERITRQECKRWFEEQFPGRTVTRSACVFCPFNSLGRWAQMRRDDPESWQAAIAADEKLRVGRDGVQQFLTGELIPLAEIKTPEDHGQLSIYDFQEECSGHCGT